MHPTNILQLQTLEHYCHVLSCLTSVFSQYMFRGSRLPTKCLNDEIKKQGSDALLVIALVSVNCDASGQVSQDNVTYNLASFKVKKMKDKVTLPDAGWCLQHLIERYL